MRRRRDPSRPWPTYAVALLGATVGAMAFAPLFWMDAILQKGIISRGEELALMIYAYTTCHAPWLCFRLTGWPKNPDDVGTLVLNAVYYAAMFLLFRRVKRWRQRRTLSDAPLCPICFYNLTGNASGVCPECGEMVSEPTHPESVP
ncbi:MAG TPA: hypothetical protein P5081_17190 [Phycisphaerae bacterium]|nr:hypothetical protein [Phycisphaerae bacterium]HRW54609.1 hypothetical protein [Phycisphaerae bacterium]